MLLLAACRSHAAKEIALRLGTRGLSSAVATSAGRNSALVSSIGRGTLASPSSIVRPLSSVASASASKSNVLALARRLSASAGVAGAAAAAATAAGVRAPSSSIPTSTPPPQPPLRRPPKSLSAWLKVYRQLSKARLSALVVATAAAGYVAGSPEEVDLGGLAWASLGTALCSAAANALNQAYEIKTDALMTRTAARPLPAGRITRGHAVGFAAVAASAGVVVLHSLAGSPVAAALGLGNVVLYSAVYTPMKQFHPCATWIGAVVGAIPPLIGWAAAASSTERREGREKQPALPPAAFVLAAGLYFWQLPHFMSLAWLCREDYARGGHRMLSLADSTGKRTAACALRNSLYLMPLGFAAVLAGTATAPFATEGAVASGVLAALAAAFWARPSARTARALFRGSLLHLPVWMGCLLVHRVPNTEDNRRKQEASAVFERVERAIERGYRSGDDLDSPASPPASAKDGPPLPLPGPFLLPPVMPGVGGARVSWGGLAGVGGGASGRCPSAAACDGEGGGDGEERSEGKGDDSETRAVASRSNDGKRRWQVWRREKKEGL